MKKVLLVLCLVAGSSSSQPNHTRHHKHAVPNKQPPAPIATYSYNSNCCTTETPQKPNKQPHRWYTPFEDPNWWLVLVAAATGGFVAWQAWETRKAAESSAKQVDVATKSLILQFRPKVRVRTIMLTEENGFLDVHVVIFNKGGTPAHIMNGQVSLDWLFTHSPKTHITNGRFEKSTLTAGAAITLSVNLIESRLMQAFAIDEARKSSPGMRMRCEGVIVYSDDNGITRKTGFGRLRNEATQNWDIDTNTEYEYAD